MIRVSAGIIRRGDGRILICKRGEGRKNAHLWEFPGGKQEEGESPAECLVRELQEELHLTVRDVRYVMSDEAQGLAFDFLCCIPCGEPVRTEHEELRWVDPREMLGLPFCPADIPAARALALGQPPVRFFFWDLDGTLMDTYPSMTYCVGEVLRERGCEMPQKEILDLMKDSLSVCLHAAAERFGMDESELLTAFRDKEAKQPPEAVRPLPGIADALSALSEAGAEHLLATHRDHTSWDYLEANGLRGYFCGGYTREAGFPRKPSPEGLLTVMREKGASPEKCMMIGDRPLDVRAGRAAGMLTCLIDPEGRFPDEPCDIYVQDSCQLAQILTPLKL